MRGLCKMYGRFLFLCLVGLLLAGCSKVLTEGNASGPKVEVAGEMVRHGIWVEHYEDGARKFHGRFTRGIPTGLHRTWHANGQPATERRYDWEGKLHEKQVDFDEQGERISKTFYEHGEEVDDAEEEAEKGVVSEGADENSVENEGVQSSEVAD